MRPIFAQDGCYFVISSIPEECGSGWRPVAVDPGPWGTCFGAPGERGPLVGDVPGPPGLMEGGSARLLEPREQAVLELSFRRHQDRGYGHVSVCHLEDSGVVLVVLLGACVEVERAGRSMAGCRGG